MPEPVTVNKVQVPPSVKVKTVVPSDTVKAVPTVKAKKLDSLIKGFEKLKVDDKTVKATTGSEPPKLTPYQGKKRSYGWFRCTKCNKNWTSASSWANTYQKCSTCLLEIYPFRQVKLKRKPVDQRNQENDRPPHQTSLCGKCKALGNKCMSSYNSN